MSAPSLVTETDLISMCAALGADRAGGPLSAEEVHLLRQAQPVPRGAVSAIRQSLARGEDPLGDAFCAIRSAVDRRDQGAFYTPRNIVQAMVAEVLRGEPTRLVDAGCGSGRYALEARRMGYAGELLAIDLDPLATLMVRASAKSLRFSLSVVQGSFLELDLPPISGITAFVSNPPYVRHHGLGPEVKEWAKAGAATLGTTVSGLAGLHALFFLKVALVSRPGDRGSFITSSEWFDANYGTVIRGLLSGPLGLTRLDIVPPATSTFSDATTTAAIASFTVGAAAAARVRICTEPTQISELDGGRVVSRSRLVATTRWSELSANRVAVNADHVELGEIASVRRGVATGANKFFVMTPTEANSRGLGGFALPVASRAVEVISAAGDLTAPRAKVILDLPDDLDDAAVAAWVAHGESLGIDKGHICSHRPCWWALQLGDTPPILATYMARQPPTFALNSVGAVNLNTLHGLRLRPGVPAGVIGPLVVWLNDNRETLVGGRTYAGSLRKVEPKEMERFRVPTVGALLAC